MCRSIMANAFRCMLGCWLSVFLMGSQVAFAAKKGGSSREESTAPTALAQGRLQMAAKEYEKAIKLFDEAVREAHAATADAGEALYLKGRALFLKGDLAACVDAMDAFMPEGKEEASAWAVKGVFLRAQALFDLKRFAEAEKIYASQTVRIMSPERKEALVAELMTLADVLAQPVDPNVPNAPQPDYGKVISLYKVILEMEISPAVRETVLVKIADVQMKNRETRLAIDNYSKYLFIFDASWKGVAYQNEPHYFGVASEERIWTARLSLATAMSRDGRNDEARREIEDLQALLRAAKKELTPLGADVAWLLVQTYPWSASIRPVPNQSVHSSSYRDQLFECGQKVKAAMDFLELYPADPRAVMAANRIAWAYQESSQYDKVLAAYDRFLGTETPKSSQPLFRLPPGEAADEKHEVLGMSPREYLAQASMQILFDRGELFSRQKKYAAARDAWNMYIQRYPNGPHWSIAMASIVTSEYEEAQQAYIEKRYEDADRLSAAFMIKHPLDNRVRACMLWRGNMQLSRSYALATEDGDKGEHKEKAKALLMAGLEEWGRLIAKYPSSNEADEAQYKSAEVYEYKLGDMQKALDGYRKVTRNFQNSALKSIERLTNETFSVQTLRTFHTNEPAFIHVGLRNIPKLTIRRYSLNLESYFRKVHSISELEQLDIALIQPDATWDVVIADYEKYRPFEQDIEIPFEKDTPGVCIVQVSSEDSEATTLVVRSDMDIIAKSSLREALVFAQNRVTGKPTPNARILLSDGEKVFATGTTGADGVYHIQDDALKDVGQLRVFATCDGHMASNMLELKGMKTSSGLSPKGYLYTARHVYRPGENVDIRGILRTVRDGVYAIPQETPFQMVVNDAKGVMLYENDITLSEFGTFSMQCSIPENASLGTWQMTVRQKDEPGPQFNGSFTVALVAPEKVQLEMTFDRPVYFRGEQVKATLDAQYVWGEPLKGKAVTVTLPDARILRGVTDDTGHYTFTYDTRSERPGAGIYFSANLDTEHVNVRQGVPLAVSEYSLSVSTGQELILAGESCDVTVQATAADGTPFGANVTLSVLRNRDMKDNMPGIDSVPVSGEQKLVLETNAETGRVTTQVPFEKGGTYTLRVDGTDRHGQVINAVCVLKVSGDDDAVKLRLFATSDTLKVGEKASVRLHSRAKKGLALVTHEGEDILSYRIMPIEPGNNALAFEVEHKHFPNMRLAVAMMDGNALRSVTHDFRVERELKVHVEPLEAISKPGAPARVRLQVTDQMGRPVSAELSLALVEEALFAIQKDPTPDLLGFFQKDAIRHAVFRETSSCAFQYQGQTRLIPQAILDEATRLRRKDAEKAALEKLSGSNLAFGVYGQTSCPEPVAAPTDAPLDDMPCMEEIGISASFRGGYGKLGRAISARVDRSKGGAARVDELMVSRWLPAIVTDANGVAEVTIPMPEKTTKWRLVARGCTVDTLVGSAQSEVMTRTDFFVTMRAPLMLREGDRVRIVATAHNLTGMAGKAEVTLTATGYDDEKHELATHTLSVDVPAKGSAEVVFDNVLTPSVSRMQFRVAAHLDTPSENSDAIVREVPVTPWGMEYVVHTGGVSSSDVTMVLKLPDQQPYRKQQLLVRISPTISQDLLDRALDERVTVVPIAHPEWDGYSVRLMMDESDASRLLAAVAGMHHAKAAHASEEISLKLRDRVLALTAHLVAAQKQDGGWGTYQNGSNSDLMHSSLAYWALMMAEKEGVVIDRNTLVCAVNFLNTRFRELPTTASQEKALILYALSFSKAADFSNLNRLYRERAHLNSYALAYLTLAFHNQGRMDIATELAGILQKTATSALSSDTPIDRVQRQEMAAVALLVFSQQPAMLETATSLADMIRNGVGCGGYASMHARGMTIMALAAHQQMATHGNTDIEIEILVNDTSVGTLSAKGNMPSQTFLIPTSVLSDPTAKLALRVQGQGTYAYAATLRGFSNVFQSSSKNPYDLAVQERRVMHLPLEYKNRPIAAGSNMALKHIEYGQRADVSCRISGNSSHCYLVLDEPLLPGATVIDGSVRGSFIRYEVFPDKLRFFIAFTGRSASFTYQISGYAPGVYRLPPAILRNGMNPSMVQVGRDQSLTFLAPGEKNPDPYRMQRYEKYTMGKAMFTDHAYQDALKYLAPLFDDYQNNRYADLPEMILWIHTEEGFYDAARIVEAFEILNEKHPDQEISLDRLMIVGKAYADIGEQERASLVFRAIIAAEFVSDSGISAALQDYGRFRRSVTFQKELWKEYPDAASMISAWFGLSQTLYQKASIADALDIDLPEHLNRVEMIADAANMIGQFLSTYPEDPLADDAAFSLINAFLDLKQYSNVTEFAPLFEKRYADSPLASSFAYMVALGHFWQHDYAKALDAAKAVAEGDSRDRDLSRYIMGQIYHANKKPVEAIAAYEQVKDLYPDAREAIEYFQEKRIEMDEVTTIPSGEKAHVALRYRNIAEVSVQVYRVDLMKLYLREKSLRRIAQVRLAGIEPLVEKVVTLGDGKDYEEKTHDVALPLKDDAAYLVICRGDDLFASGLVLVTPLEVRVQEYPDAGRLRVTVLDAATGMPRQGVEVKAVGSQDGAVRHGESDLRGLFVADNLDGQATVIVKDGESRYGFYRGVAFFEEVALEDTNATWKNDAPSLQLNELDFQENLIMQNKAVQGFNSEQYDKMRRMNQKSVQLKSLNIEDSAGSEDW